MIYYLNRNRPVTIDNQLSEKPRQVRALLLI